MDSDEVGRLYSELPWYRQSGAHHVFMLVHLLTLGCLPLIAITCIVLVTGNIYYAKVDEQGNLKAWSGANRVIAFLLLLFPLVLIGVVVATIAGF